MELVVAAMREERTIATQASIVHQAAGVRVREEARPGIAAVLAA
jgi:hypothetical protein